MTDENVIEPIVQIDEEDEPEVAVSTKEVALAEKPKKKRSSKEDFPSEKHVLSELENIKLEIELEKAKAELAALKDKALTMSSREHDAEELELIDRQIARTNESKTAAAKIRSQKEYDNVKVTGKFLNRRAPGCFARLTYIKYDDDPVKWTDFYDGKVYTIPRGFADQINEYYHSPVFVQKTGPIDDPDNPGSQIAEVDRSNKKYAFVPVGF